MRFSALAHFFPKQKAATRIADQHRYVLYGGTRGPGKSYWLRWYLLRRLLRLAARGVWNARVGLFCEDYPALKDRQISKIETEFPAWLGRVQETKSDGLGFHLRPEYGGGVLALRNLDDPAKYQSAEFAAMGIDELTKNRERVFHILRGSLRWPGVDFCQFVAASNSNGLGREWVRQYFIERNLPAELKGHERDFVYIQASPRDNPYLTATYWDDLATLPERLRRSWLDGDWYVANEGVVFSEFTDANLTDDEPDPKIPIEIAFDDGYIDPRAILFIQRTAARVLVFDEFYHQRHLGELCAREIVEYAAARGLTLDLAVGSHEAVEFREHLRRQDIVARGLPAPIVDGIANLRGLICDGKGYRALWVNRKCHHLLAELQEGYHYDDERKTSEKPADESNHACDALRTWAWVRARRAEFVGPAS